MAFDEVGQAETVERKVEICQRAYKLLTETVGIDPHDIIFDPNILAVATGIEEHDRLRDQLHRGDPHHQGDAARARSLRRRLQPVVLVPRQQRRARGDALGVPLPRDRRRHGHGHRQRGQLEVYEDIPKDLLEHVEDVLFCRRADATERLIEFAEQIKGGKRQEEARSTCPGARAGAERLEARARPRHRRLYRGGHRGSPPAVRPAAAGDRRPADGRHEGRRRPVRCGQDVPAPGREECARHEEGPSRSSRAPYMEEGEKRPALHVRRPARPAEADTRGKVVLATVKGDVHDIGKNIVGVVLGCNNYEVIDLGVMVAVRQDPRDRDSRRRRRHRRPERPDHAVAR